MRIRQTEDGLRVLSPVSQGDDESVVEGVDELDQAGEDEDQLDTAPTSPLANRGQGQTEPRGSSRHLPDFSAWQRNIEAHLHVLKTEIAALREQLSANHLLSSSTYSLGGAYYTLSTRQRIVHIVKMYARSLSIQFVRQVIVQLGILLLVLLYGRFKGDYRIENWVRDVSTRIMKRMKSILSGLAFWLLDLFGRDGRLGFIGRVLRIT